jgi:hypothetical protein
MSPSEEVGMEASPEHVAAVELWLGLSFPGAEVLSQAQWEPETRLFRARTPGTKGPAPELAISDLACEDYTADEIVAALQRQRAAERLRENPGTRMMLRRDLKLVPAPSPRKA